MARKPKTAGVMQEIEIREISEFDKLTEDNLENISSEDIPESTEGMEFKNSEIMALEELTEIQERALDLNSDGKITISDISKFNRYFLGMVPLLK